MIEPGVGAPEFKERKGHTIDPFDLARRDSRKNSTRFRVRDESFSCCSERLIV